MPIQIQTRVSRAELVDVALGRAAADLVIENGRLLDVYSGEIRAASVAIKGERIAYVGDDASHTIGERTEVIDAAGYHLSPGLIDAHVHIEASMVTPTQFARAVLPRGNTAVLWETLWTANVLGIPGIERLLDECRLTPLKFFATAASGVPCTSPELATPAQVFSDADIARLLARDDVVGLGELVLFNQVLRNESEIRRRIDMALQQGKSVDGSVPGFVDRRLNAYAAAGAQSDHEAITLAEAIERIRLGLRLVIREGSSMRNLAELVRVATERGLSTRRCCFCVDDKDIREIEREGLVDHLVRQAIRSGLDPVQAVRMATLNPAEHFGLERDLGGIAPGRIADILLVGDLNDFAVETVIASGRVVARSGQMVVELPQPPAPDWMLNTVRLPRALGLGDFACHSERIGQTRVRALQVFGEQIVSVELPATLAVEGGEILPDVGRDLLRMAVVERHGKTAGPNIGLGFVAGFGLRRGAIASSVSPDIHQIVTVGVDKGDMAVAVDRLAELQGGIVLAAEGRVLAELALPVGGLMSSLPYEQVIAQLERLSAAAAELGCRLPSPFMTLAFAACPTLIELKLSDLGLIDVRAGRLLPLELD
jgi:adenine deaminase